MTLKEICCDKDISIELKKNGFSQICYACHHSPDLSDNSFNAFVSPDDKIIRREHDWISAPTAEEILKVLPDEIKTDSRTFGSRVKQSYCFHIDRENGIYCIGYICYSHNSDYENEILIEIDNNKLCNALAKMYNYLAKNDLLK